MTDNNNNNNDSTNSIQTLRLQFPEYQIISARYDFETRQMREYETFDFQKFQKMDNKRFRMKKIVYYGEYKYTISPAPFSERMNILSLPLSSNSTAWNILYTADVDELLSNSDLDIFYRT